MVIVRSWIAQSVGQPQSTHQEQARLIFPLFSTAMPFCVQSALDVLMQTLVALTKQFIRKAMVNNL